MEKALLDKSVVEYVLSQSPVVVVLCIGFWLYVKEKRATEKRLVDLLRERKADRDEALRMNGRIETHLARADAFEAFARASLKETLDPRAPKRRQTDRFLKAALEPETTAGP